MTFKSSAADHLTLDYVPPPIPPAPPAPPAPPPPPPPPLLELDDEEEDDDEEDELDELDELDDAALDELPIPPQAMWILQSVQEQPSR